MTGEELEGGVEKLEDYLLVLNEFGLFSTSDTHPDEVKKKIEEARDLIASGELPKAATALTDGVLALHTELDKRSALWQWIHVYQLPIGIWYLVIFVSLLYFGLFSTHSEALTLLGVPSAVVIAGSLGAVLRGTWWLHRQVAQRLYRPHFVLSHLLAPFIGALFGMLSFLLLTAGVLSLGANGNDSLDQAALPRAVAFFAGFSWEWMIAKLDQLRAQ